MSIQNILDIIKDDLTKLESEFTKNLDSKASLIPQIGKYILFSGGKRFRPIILMLCSRCCGYKGNEHISLASLFEFIHTATLLHDDVVDGATIRRGNSSVNSIWGTDASVLVGDFLFSKAFSLMVGIGNIKILNVISSATTIMAEGEILQLINEKDIDFSEEDYISIIIDKTASLISAACQVGAILGNASKEKEEAIKNYGLNLGIAFQLIDDILDYTSDEKVFGKVIGKDLLEGKVTLPIIHTLRSCNKADYENIKRIFEKEDRDENDVKLIIELINRYNGIIYTQNKAKEYVKKSKKFLDVFNSSNEFQPLYDIADYVVERNI